MNRILLFIFSSLLLALTGSCNAQDFSFPAFRIDGTLIQLGENVDQVHSEFALGELDRKSKDNYVRIKEDFGDGTVIYYQENDKLIYYIRTSSPDAVGPFGVKIGDSIEKVRNIPEKLYEQDEYLTVFIPINDSPITSSGLATFIVEFSNDKIIGMYIGYAID